MATWSGQPSVRGATETAQMMLLTCSSLGVAFTWGVEMTYGTPYLLSLGLTKGQASFVWLAGPLSGLIVQPVVGVVSDTSTLKWGRRRPFIIVGSILVACGLLTLGFTREIVGFLFGSPPAAPLLDSTATALPSTATHIEHRNIIIALAVLALYLTDFAINAVMSCARSLLVDTLPLAKQQDGAAWASRMASFGHLVGYGAGAVDLVHIFGPVLGDTQFKKLSAVAAISILMTSSITCWAVSERVLLRSSMDPHGAHSSGSGPGSWLAFLAKIFRQIWSTLITLPPRIQAICWAVFWGWIAWFPFIVYSSTWVGETYFRYDVQADAGSTGDAVGDMGRIGSYALTAYSCATVMAATILPLLIRSPFAENYTRRPPARVARLAEHFEKSRPDLLTAWTLGHIVFACCMVFAPFATSFRSATAIVTLCGIPYTVVSWAPTTFLGIEINRMTADGAGGSMGHHSRLSDEKLPISNIPKREHGRARHSSRPRHNSDDPHAPASSSGELSGIYFGILNIYMTVPQFIGNLISACVFAVLEPGKSPELAKDAHPSEHHNTDGPNAIGVTFFIGAVFALAEIDARLPELEAANKFIHDNPELAYEEHKAHDYLVDMLTKLGFHVRPHAYGVETAFMARIGKGAGRCVYFNAEYDALPDVGHACGHNLIATASLAAFLGLAAAVRKTIDADGFEGHVVLMGTPAKEGGGGKLKLIDAGAYEGVDACLMVYPVPQAGLPGPTRVFFKGREAHAAMEP